MSDAVNSAAERVIGRPFPAGVSGNPSGRTKVQREIQAALECAGFEAKDRLIALLRSDDERVALAACRDILDRVIGKAPEAPEDQQKREDTVVALLMAME